MLNNFIRINMKFSAVRRWKIKERNFNQKYKLKAGKKTQHSRYLKGKFIFLLTKTKLCAVLRFLSKKLCVTESLILIDDKFLNLVSPKYIIPHNKHKKLCAKVQVTKDFQNSCEKFVKRNGVTKKTSSAVVQNAVKTHDDFKKEELKDENRKITPIKILSCKICNEKFLKKELLEEHVSKVHFSDEDATDSEDELFDEEQLKQFLSVDSNSSIKTIKIKQEVSPTKAIGRFTCLQCSAVFSSDETLVSCIEIFKKLPILTSFIFNSLPT